MKIKNENLANTVLGLKTGPVTGDANGVFDLPEEDAKALLATPGWSPLKKGKAIEPPPAAPPPADDITEEVDAAVDEVTKAAEEPDDLDLDSMTKGELLSVAEEHGIEVDTTMRKADIKEAIEGALNGGD